MKKKVKTGENLSLAIEHIERDHGGCDQNTCTMSVALRHGYDLIAIDTWINSGAASPDFPNRLGYSFMELQKQCAEMTAELEHVQCPKCNAVLWLPDECDYHCDSCGEYIPRDAVTPEGENSENDTQPSEK
jgi:hypothetical protein